MNPPPYRIVPLYTAAHDRSLFASGSAPLDGCSREQVAQDIRRRVAGCFVALSDEQRIAGSYTLAAARLLMKDPPLATAKKLPRYTTVPAVRMGRRAVDLVHKRRGLGGALLNNGEGAAIPS